MTEIDDTITFTRTHPYRFVRELGFGACGKTVLLKDDQIDFLYACKKFAPSESQDRSQLYNNFVIEVKILHQMHHRNVVRVYNHYLYPEKHLGYILMEYVEGTDIKQYLQQNESKANDIFAQLISGFKYLEENKILHRDIRLSNLLVSLDGTVKIIDFGFGKLVFTPSDFDKSVTLNWPFNTPKEFAEKIYDFQTELYFVGNFFRQIVEEANLIQFDHYELLLTMCESEPANRAQSFLDIDKGILSHRVPQTNLSDTQLNAYREFSKAIYSQVIKIEKGCQYKQDLGQLQVELESAYNLVQLEEEVPDAALILRCFVYGTFWLKRKGLRVRIVRDFLNLMRDASRAQKSTIMANIHNRLDAIPRVEDKPAPVDDDLPF